MDLNLKDKVALVTGGSRGIGTAICLSMAAEGAKVVVNYNSNGAKAQQVVKDIKEKYGTEAIAVGANVASEAEVLAMYAKIAETFPQVDILVNNAAVCPVGPVREMALETWQQAMDVNLNGTFLCSREFVKMQALQSLIFLHTFKDSWLQLTPPMILYLMHLRLITVEKIHKNVRHGQSIK